MTTSKMEADHRDGLPLDGTSVVVPDLARLSLNNEPVSGGTAQPGSQVTAPAAPLPAPSLPVHITINATGSTVIVNTGSPAPVLGPEHLARRALQGAAAPALLGPNEQVPTADVPAQDANIQAAVASTDAAGGAADVAPNGGAAVVVNNGPGEEPFHLAPLPLTTINRLPWDDAKEHICPREPRGKKWYAVTAGMMVGIWPSWTETAPLVEGVPGNVHESFKSRAAAEHYYYTNKDLGRVFILGP